MRIEQFASLAQLDSKSEVEKVRLLVFLALERDGSREFTVDDVSAWFEQLHYSEPNKSRLRSRLKESSSFIRGSTTAHFRLHARQIAALKVEYPQLTVKSEEVVSGDSILPTSLYTGTRPYIENLAKQINASFEHNIFDGCAVLMRRLLEVLLILSYQHHKIEAAIQNANGEYYMLDRIIGNAETNPTLALSRNSRSALDVFRTLGNFSAHKIYYGAKRPDIQKHALEYRALIEELLYKAGIK